MKINYLIKTLLIFCLATTCGFSSASASEPELVMTPGMTIEARTPFGNIIIEASDNFNRRYAWNSYNKTFKLYARSERWLGSKGLYRGIGDSEIHAVLNEGQQHFSTIEEALAWLASTQKRMKWVYTSEGLVVGWDEQKGKDIHALIVDVWQIYVKGQKPINMSGANNETIRVTFKNTPTYPSIGKFVPSSPNIINNRWFSGRAIDSMNQFGIPSSKVEEVISKAEKHIEGNYCWYNGMVLEPSISVFVWSDSDGKVWIVRN